MVEARQGGSELDFADAAQFDGAEFRYIGMFRNFIYPPATAGGTDKYAARVTVIT